MDDSADSLLRRKPWARPLPVTLSGRTVRLEPLGAERHAAALWQAVKGHDSLWTWMADGPFADEEEFVRSVARKEQAADAVFLAVVPLDAGVAAGYASWMRMEPAQGVVEIGNILFAPSLQRTTAATEAVFLMARHVFETLGYRRLEWKCDALNRPSRRAAERLGFTFEGVFRQHMVVKGRNRDTAWFSMLDGEWAARRRAFEGWLGPGNFDERGRQRRPLGAFATDK
jgi:RimJ/RimL family protein N-acetyltransferase